MASKILELSRILTQFVPEDGLHPTFLPGIYCIKVSHPKPRAKMRWGAALCLIVQGDKELMLERKIYRFAPGHYVATPIDLPVVSSVVTASPSAPFLALKINFDAMPLHEVAGRSGQADSDVEPASRAIFGGACDDALIDTALRLARLLLAPQDAPALLPLILQELSYRLLQSDDGSAIHQFLRSGSPMQRISRAVHALRANLADDIDVAALARAVNMSRSAFFKYFKQATALSPVQYQKRLRLLEAKRLMQYGESVAGAAFKVGYNSATQFSREYSRMFGDAPLRDVQKSVPDDEA